MHALPNARLRATTKVPVETHHCTMLARRLLDAVLKRALLRRRACTKELRQEGKRDDIAVIHAERRLGIALTNILIHTNREEGVRRSGSKELNDKLAIGNKLRNAVWIVQHQRTKPQKHESSPLR